MLGKKKFHPRETKMLCRLTSESQTFTSHVQYTSDWYAAINRCTHSLTGATHMKNIPLTALQQKDTNTVKLRMHHVDQSGVDLVCLFVTFGLKGSWIPGTQDSFGSCSLGYFPRVRDVIFRISVILVLCTVRRVNHSRQNVHCLQNVQIISYFLPPSLEALF